ncbi:MAG: hypothetical protein MJA83_07670, partial [Gammaproteobacteria bacterium]|nr:hypothetical protein [Gammaproteobacteria bacterium]
RQAFLDALIKTPPRHKVRSEFLVLLHFSHLLPADRLDAVIDERLGQITQDINMLEDILDRVEKGEIECSPGPVYGIGLALAQLRAGREYMVANRERLFAADTVKPKVKTA